MDRTDAVAVGELLIWSDRVDADDCFDTQRFELLVVFFIAWNRSADESIFQDDQVLDRAFSFD